MPQEKKQIILNCEELETRSALLINGHLEDYQIERKGDDIVAGSIYLGKIVRIEPGLEACFVDIGAEKNAFMHFRDMLPASYDILDNIKKIGEERERVKETDASPKKKKHIISILSEKFRNLVTGGDRAKRLKEMEERIHTGKITIEDIPRVFPAGSELLVQVTKGPIGTKGARVTTNITIPGRYLVLLPYSKHIGLSSRIEDKKERDRLRKILLGLNLPEGMGLICRTVGEHRKAVFFQRDLEMLLELWSKVDNALLKPKAPALVYAEPDLLERTVRDLLTDDIDEIVVDDKDKYDFLVEALKKFVGNDFNTQITRHKRAESVFDRYKVTPQVAEIYNRIVNLPGGGYLCIDETEALVAIDINTGKSKAGKAQRELILNTNLEAAKEIARQIRLRNIGGQIVIDFIDMANSSDREQVNRTMNKLADLDRARTKILPISKFGLMEMTRQRESESVQDSLFDPCPYCGGSGHVKSAISMSVEIQRRLLEILKQRTKSKKAATVRVILNPAVLARLKNDDAKILYEMESKYGRDLEFRADPAIHVEEFRLIDPKTGELL